jgi:predicted nucleic acid-binding protein
LVAGSCHHADAARLMIERDHAIYVALACRAQAILITADERQSTMASAARVGARLL